MAEDKQRIVGIIKVPLMGIAEELGVESYAYVRPATYEDQMELDDYDVKSHSPRENIEYQLKVVRDHFVGGKIKAFTGEDFELVDMTADDAVATKHLADHLYFAIMGIDTDPKATSSEAKQDNSTPKSEESDTATTSSEDSQTPSDTATSDK